VVLGVLRGDNTAGGPLWPEAAAASTGGVGVIGDLAARLGVSESTVLHVLVRLAERETKDCWVDVGGLRGTCRGDQVVLERYLTVECSPGQILAGET